MESSKTLVYAKFLDHPITELHCRKSTEFSEMKVGGIDVTYANRIIEYGPYGTAEDLMKRSGIDLRPNEKSCFLV